MIYGLCNAYDERDLYAHGLCTMLYVAHGNMYSVFGMMCESACKRWCDI